MESQIKSATANLVFPYLTFSGSSIEIVDSFLVRVSESKESLIQKLLAATGFVTVSNFKGFSHEENVDFQDRDYYERLQVLDELLGAHLKNLHKYIIGGYSCFHIYVIGQTQDQNWVGVSTQAVWT